MERNTIEFEQVIEKGCGIDVHKETAVTTVRGKGIKTETRTFSTFTSSLKEIERMAQKYWDNPYSHRKHRGLLKTNFQYTRRFVRNFIGQCTAFKKCAWQEN